MENENKRALIGLIAVGIFAAITIALLFKVPPGVEVGNGTFNARIDIHSSPARWRINCNENDNLVISAKIDMSTDGRLLIYNPSGVKIAQDAGPGERSMYTVSCDCLVSGMYEFEIGFSWFSGSYDITFTVSGSTAIPTVPGFDVSLIMAVMIGVIVYIGIRQKKRWMANF